MRVLNFTKCDGARRMTSAWTSGRRTAHAMPSDARRNFTKNSLRARMASSRR